MLQKEEDEWLTKTCALPLKNGKRSRAKTVKGAAKGKEEGLLLGEEEEAAETVKEQQKGKEGTSFGKEEGAADVKGQNDNFGQNPKFF